MSDELQYQIVSKLEQMDQKFDKMEALQESQGRLLTQLIGIVKSTNEKVDHLEQTVQEVKEAMVAKEDLDYFDMKISQHERSLEKNKTADHLAFRDSVTLISPLSLRAFFNV